MGHSSTPNTPILTFISNWLVEIPLGVVFSCAGGRIELSLEAERLILDWTSAEQAVLLATISTHRCRQWYQIGNRNRNVILQTSNLSLEVLHRVDERRD